MFQETTHVAAGWQQLYYAAIVESNHEKCQQLIKQTERAIGARYHGACRSLGDDEIREMAEAVWNLLQLRRENNTV